MRDRDEDPMNPAPFLVSPSNCWRRAPSERVAFLVDAADYYAAVAAAIERAQHQVLLLGWDFHSRVRLRRDGVQREGPDDLIGLLDAAVRRNRRLHVYILEWDFALFYARERELLPQLRFGARTHRRIEFRLDDRCPTGASHHQKIVVIDDAIAFSGGIDITACRWDTSAHEPDDPRRADPGFPTYGPFHDVQIAVDGKAAAALAELARERWQRAGGRRIKPVDAHGDPWPLELEVDLADVEVAIARTEPALDGREETREVERSYIESIAAARHSIYIENQYLTAYSIRDAIAERLRQADGPEVVIVTPKECSGWLEHRTMGALRCVFLDQLRDADGSNRLRVYFPTHTNGPDIFVHAKVMIVDDRILRIGSANLANRSMGLDTECDLLIESRDERRTGDAIAGLRNRLLGEHLGVAPGRVEDVIRDQGSLSAAIESLRGGRRSLEPVARGERGWLDDLRDGQILFDPERPVSYEQLERMMAVELPSQEGVRTLVRPGLTVLLILVLGGTWYWTPLREWLTPDRVTALAEPLRTSAAGPFIWAAIFAVAGLLMVPLTALVVASALLFGPIVGGAVSLGAGIVCGVGGFLMGRSLWRDTVRRFAGARLTRISHALGKRGILSMAAVRLVPIAPFTVVNMVAGASHVGLRDFTLGTALGLTPGILGLSILSDRAATAVTDAGAGAWVGLIAIAFLFGGMLVWLRRRFATQGGKDDAGSPSNAG